MNVTEHILIAVDDSPASEEAVSYAGSVLRGTDGCRVRLFHVLEPIGPPWIPLHGDLETEPPAGGQPEARVIGEALERARPVLERMTGILTDAGLERDRIETTWFVASREDSLAFEILSAAEESTNPTVVVGRTALPWYRELFKSHLGNQLVKKGEAVSVWIVA